MDNQTAQQIVNLLRSDDGTELQSNIAIFGAVDEILLDTLKSNSIEVIQPGYSDTHIDAEDKSLHTILIGEDLNIDQVNTLRKDLRRIFKEVYGYLVFMNTVPFSKEQYEFFGGSEYKSFDINEVSLLFGEIGITQNDLNTPEITEFIDASNDYLFLMENYTSFEVKDLLLQLNKKLSILYAKALSIPSFADSSPDTPKKNVNEFFEMLNNLSVKLGRYDLYYGVFNPLEKEEVSAAGHNISNDISEIYEDIKVCMLLFSEQDLRSKQSALWQFKFSFENHWGAHLTKVHPALHFQCEEIWNDL